MPREQLNWPEPSSMRAVRDVKTGEEVVDDVTPMSSVFNLHWTSGAGMGIPQLSVNVDWTQLEKMVDWHREHPEEWWGESDRAEFWSEALTRADLNALIKHARRCRDAVFGADE